MSSRRISISEPHLNDKVSKYISEAFLKNEISSYGENINQFEIALETYLGQKKHVAATNSGTSAIHLALIQLGVTKDDEVICQSFTFCASANPIIYQGAKPIFVDSEKDTWNMCPQYLEGAIKDRIKKGKKPKAIILVHLYGMPAKLEELLLVAKKYDISVIEDAAEALGSTYKGRKCGTFGDFSILSFNGNKIITTSGGGALVCHSKNQKDKAIYYARQARDNTSHYQHSEIGYNYRMTNISAGIGRGQMEVLDDYVKLRQTMNMFYQDIFKTTDGINVFKEYSKDISSNHWLSCIIFEENAPFNKETLYNTMNKFNIETRPLWKPMHLQPIFKDAPYYGGNQSELLFDKGLCLPSGSSLNNSDKQRIFKVIEQLLQKK